DRRASTPSWDRVTVLSEGDHALRITRTLQSSPRTPQAARVLTGFFTAGLPRSVRDAARLLASELVTNCLTHGPPGGCIRLSVEMLPGRLRMEVADQGRGFEPY